MRQTYIKARVTVVQPKVRHCLLQASGNAGGEDYGWGDSNEDNA